MSAQAWEDLLARFEADLVADAVPAAGWEPVAAALPLPLAERAADILRRQQKRMEQLRHDIAGVRDQLEALRRMGPEQSAPAYLDVEG